MALVFFGVHLVLLGALLRRSGYVPAVLGEVGLTIWLLVKGVATRR